MAQVNTALQIQDKRDIESTKRAYFLREKAIHDRVSAFNFAQRQKQEGRQEGIQKGIQQVIERMSKKGLSVDAIADLISLTPQEVSKLII